MMSDVVETATKKFADLRRRLQLHKHHLEVLHKMKSNGKMPRYLRLETPKIKAELFSDEVTAEVTTRYQATLKQASEDLLDLTIQGALTRTPSCDKRLTR